MDEIKKDFKRYAILDKHLDDTKIDRYINFINNYNSSVIEERSTNFREIDVFSRLIMDRIIFLGSEINSNTANIIVAQLLYLDSVEQKDINIYINSPGGEIYSGLSILDTLEFIRSSVSTTCTGLAASMAAILLACGEKGRRMALKHARIMIHQPSGGAKGQATDLEINLKQILALKKEVYQILSERTGKDLATIEKDCERDHWMTTDEAKDYGIIDGICIKK